MIAWSDLHRRNVAINHKGRRPRPPLDGDGRPAPQAAHASGLRHPRDGRHHSRPSSAIVPNGLVLSVITVLLLLFSGWNGGDLVFRHRVGVADF